MRKDCSVAEQKKTRAKSQKNTPKEIMIVNDEPGVETRIAILMADAKINNLDINYKITEFIASSITDSVESRVTSIPLTF